MTDKPEQPDDQPASEPDPNFELMIRDGAGIGKRLVVDAETMQVLDENGEPSGMTLSELAQSDEFDLRVQAPDVQLTFDVVDDPDELPLIASTIKLKGGEYGVIGQWKAGAKAYVMVGVEIESVRFDQLKTTTGIPYGMCRVHLAGKPERVETPKVAPQRAGKGRKKPPPAE